MSLVRYSHGLRARILAGDLPAWLEKHPRKDYITRATLARPSWTRTHELVRLDKRRKGLSKMRGEEHVLDHIIPISHPRVCGLTVLTNLRIVPRRCNAAKLNHWCEWHGDLFTEPEQFTLFGPRHETHIQEEREVELVCA